MVKKAGYGYNYSKIQTKWFYQRVTCLKDADNRIVSSLDPDQTAPDVGLHCFTQFCLSQTVGSL